MLEAFFDVSSPWTYLGFHAAREMAAELGIAITWKPILVGGIFNTRNPSVYAWRAKPVPEKQSYMHKDLQDWARMYQLTINWPPTVFPVNSVKVMRGCLHLERHGKLEAFAEAAFRAYWSEDLDISQDEVIAGLLTEIDVDEAAFFAGIVDVRIKEALRTNTAELMDRGGFGSPTFFVDGSDMYFGNDRLSLVRRALEASRLHEARSVTQLV